MADPNSVKPKPESVDMAEQEWLDLTPQSRYYYRNRESEINRVNEMREDTKDWVNSVKQDKGCQECGEDHPACLDFHHIDEKDDSIWNMAHNNRSKDSIRDEMSKCIVLCANCHRKEHWKS